MNIILFMIIFLDVWQKINFDYLNYKGILGYKKLTAKLLQVNDIWKIFLNQCHLFDIQTNGGN